MNTSDATRPCTRCKGSGVQDQCEFRGENYVKVGEKPCYRCKGASTFARPDFVAIVKALTATRGKNKGGVRASAPEYRMDDHESCRVYYTWRLFRFHAGFDVTMPMMAGLAIGGDPYEKDLDQLAELLAFRATKAPSAGTIRWGRALGSISDAQIRALETKFRLPWSALEGGPVADENKPEEEGAELR